MSLNFCEAFTSLHPKIHFRDSKRASGWKLKRCKEDRYTCSKSCCFVVADPTRQISIKNAATKIVNITKTLTISLLTSPLRQDSQAFVQLSLSVWVEAPHAVVAFFEKLSSIFSFFLPLSSCINGRWGAISKRPAIFLPLQCGQNRSSA